MHRIWRPTYLNMQSFATFVESRYPPNVEAFIEDFAALGYWNPIFDRELVIRNEVAVKVFPQTDGAINIESIRAFQPQQGAGTRVMQDLIRLADKHHVVLMGYAKRFPTGTSGTLTTAQLKTWYRKFGFIVNREGDMKREPK